MKYLALTGLLISHIAMATIEGPDCDDLTEKQEALLKAAAEKYVEKKNSKRIQIVKDSISATRTDCHDYDGTHSATEFALEWTQIRKDKEMTCEQEIGVTVNYENKLLVIDENSTFDYEVLDDAVCMKK